MYRLLSQNKPAKLQHINLGFSGEGSAALQQWNANKAAYRALRCWQEETFLLTRTNTSAFTCTTAAHALGHKQNEANLVKLLQRNQSSFSTTHAEAQKAQRLKRIRKDWRKYVELLEVTSSSASEKRSRVKSLKSKKLQAFIMGNTGKGTAAALASQPAEYQPLDVDSFVMRSGTLDERPLVFFHKRPSLELVKEDAAKRDEIYDSFRNFREVMESMHQECEVEEQLSSLGKKLQQLSSDEELAIEELEILGKYDKSHIEEAVKVKQNKKNNSKLHTSPEHERLAKEKAMHINLTAFLKICVATDMISRAHNAIIMYRHRKYAKQTPAERKSLITIDMYNIVLHAYAERGFVDRLEDMLKLIEEDKLTYNEQTFAAIFELLGRLEQTPKTLQRIKFYIKKAEDMHMTLHQIMNNAKFVGDQREQTLAALRSVLPDFKPEYVPPPLEYNNVLLNHLNQSPAVACGSKKCNYDRDSLETMSREQLKIELDGYVTIESIAKTKEYQETDAYRAKLADLENSWREQINVALLRDMNTLKARTQHKFTGVMNFIVYLCALEPQHYVDILIKEIYTLAEGSETFSPTVGILYKDLGQKVQQKFLIEEKKRNGLLQKMGEIYEGYLDELVAENSAQSNVRQIWQRLVHQQRVTGPSMDIMEVTWPLNVQIGIGRFLYNIMMHDVKIDSNIMQKNAKQKTPNLVPAFYTLFRNNARIMKEEIKTHPVLARLVRASCKKTLTFESSLVPMLCPPQPWSTPHTGGYLLCKSELIRLPQQAFQQWERITSSEPQSMYPALDSLNQLASIPWRVNTDVLDVMIKVFQAGGDDKLDVPRPPSALPPLPSLPQHDTSITKEERQKLFQAKLLQRRKQAEMYSLWCDALYRLSLANHYRNRIFWLPHNMDFRGRVYPVPPHLNHLGSDLARSILIFDQAKPLGLDGFSWLKLHCINLTGLKKRDSVRERLLYAESVMPEILDSADKPLDGRQWWTKSDEPWQTLSCCMEIAKVLRSENPEEYLCRLPIHQDGSCNGLQHYAALGRDAAGGASVNLTPAPVPQDVYSTVAGLVESARRQDAENGLHVAQILEGFVLRKVIKQTVMTTVYGVTRFGARLQIARQLKDMDTFPKEWVWPASTYLTNKTFESLCEMFTSTREIQDWFTDCARLISTICGRNVEWVTPLGLPVVQPYTRKDSKKFLNKHYQLIANDMFERPNIMKQKNAFPPNFIHSLDSSHMMLTSLHCERKGLTFVSVHDCFWTHACSVPDMNKICREQFVALHSQPILQDLSEFMVQKFAFRNLTQDDTPEYRSKSILNRVLRQLPERGDLDLNQVLQSTYFFS